jgi:hypothetical protein
MLAFVLLFRGLLYLKSPHIYYSYIEELVGKVNCVRYACCWIRDTVICILTRPRVVQSGVWIPLSARDFPFLQTVQTGSGVHPASYSVGKGVHSRVAKRPGGEFDSPPSSNEIMNEWSYTTNSPMCLDRIDRENFTFTTVLELGRIDMDP